jgi:hypothetical protein
LSPCGPGMNPSSLRTRNGQMVRSSSRMVLLLNEAPEKIGPKKFVHGSCLKSFQPENKECADCKVFK